MIATIPSAVLIGVDGKPVFVEVHVSNGLPGFTVVGLPDAAVRESRDRGRAGLDLPIAIGVLVASGALDARTVENTAFVGELGLDGSLRGVPGTLALAEALGRYRLVVPAASGHEAVLAREGEIRMAGSLGAVVEQLAGHRPWNHSAVSDPPSGPSPRSTTATSGMDLSDVRGQRLARRALEVAAAGGHHLLMAGPPGSGKTMLANRFPGLLPDLPRPRALE